jgi:hypothetical protein
VIKEGYGFAGSDRGSIGSFIAHKMAAADV